MRYSRTSVTVNSQTPSLHGKGYLMSLALLMRLRLSIINGKRLRVGLDGSYIDRMPKPTTKPLSQRLARRVDLWLGEGLINKGMGAFITATPAILSFSLFGKLGALAYFGFALLAGVFWFGGHRRNQLQEKAVRHIEDWGKKWKELRPVRIKAAQCALGRHGLMRFVNSALDLKEDSPEAFTPHVSGEAKEVIKFFEDFCQTEY